MAGGTDRAIKVGNEHGSLVHSAPTARQDISFFFSLTWHREDSDPGLYRGLHQHVAGVGDARHARIADQSQGLKQMKARQGRESVIYSRSMPALLTIKKN